MMHLFGILRSPLVWAYALSFTVSTNCLFAEDSSTDQRELEFFETHIRPVLVRECYECHSEDADSVMGGLRLDTREGLLTGGDSGPAVVPGNLQKSLLIDALRQQNFEMPPEGKLDDSTIRNFERWVSRGAPDPRVAAPHGKAESSDTPSDKENHWAFQPIEHVSPPAVHDEDWPTSKIDRFILHRLEEKDLQPVGDADRTTLIRRAYFDLWGLPPDPEAVAAFENDDSPDAFAKVVDRLLDSPRFGERWGRHWLDVARYAESTGHERNFLYPHAWRYRDYVIDAFNNDKPFDQFLTEQLAGDLLPADDQKERDEQRVATGFLAIGSRNLLDRDDEFELDTADDQINVTTRAFMGLTVSCARCHDHKFDPISTKEYYSLASIFVSTEELYGTQPGTGGGNNRHPSDLVPLGADGSKLDAEIKKYKKQLAEATKVVGKTQNALKKLTSLPEKKQKSQQKELAKAKQAHEAAEQRLKELREQKPQAPSYAMGVRESDKVVDTPVRISGDVRKEGDVAPRGVLECCTIGSAPSIPDDQSGRLQLAQWMTQPSHPLTSRVAVNRVWHYLMGRGIVPTVDNFGINGRPPSHPELLDFLAATFQENGWSVKHLIRRVMLSHVYQLSATHDAHNAEIDPGNVYRWRWSVKRLEAEAIRDTLLTASGNLDRCSPQSGSRVAELGDGCLVRQIDADELKVPSSHRSIYLPTARYFEPEILQVFDGASASLVVGDRAETNVPAQALFLLNNPFVVQQARATAECLLESKATSRPARIQKMYQRVLGRKPSESEIQRAIEYLHRSERALASDGEGGTTDQSRSDVWAGLVQSLFASAEFRYLY